MVFISHSTQDAYPAEAVKTKLREAGIDVWVDQDNLNAGDEWRREIDIRIANADALVLILSPNSYQAPYVIYEWAFALGQGKKIIPLLLNDDEQIIPSRLTGHHRYNIKYFQKAP